MTVGHGTEMVATVGTG